MTVIMKRIFLFFLLLSNTVAFAAMPEGLLQKLEAKWPRNHSINFVFHGHSVPSGYFLTPEVHTFEAYPHLVHKTMAKRFPFAVINTIVTAIGGENSISGSARFDSDVLSHRPDIVFIDYALNDRSQPIEKVEAAWRVMIEKTKAANIPLVLITPTGAINANFDNPADPLTQRAEMIRRLGKEYNVLVADVSAAWQAEIAKGTAMKDLLSNGHNHPNARGHGISAEAISAVLLQQ